MCEAIKIWNQLRSQMFFYRKHFLIFKPAAGSHLEGVWERRIGSVRRSLYQMLKQLFCEMEAIFNGRVSDDQMM